MTKKIILIVVGVVLLLCGVGAVVPGGLLTGFSGADNTIEGKFNAISTPTNALVSETAQVSDARGIRTAGIGATTIKIAGRSTEPIFIGVASAADVESYLGTTSFDEVTDFRLSPFRIDTARHQGRGDPGPPTDQTFWVDSATGTAPELDWKITTGDYRLVMMNLDGSPGVVADTRFGITVDGLFGIGLGVLIAGSLVALVGIALIVVGIALRATPAPQPAFAAGYPPPGGPGTAGGAAGFGARDSAAHDSAHNAAPHDAGPWTPDVAPSTPAQPPAPPPPEPPPPPRPPDATD